MGPQAEITVHLGETAERKDRHTTSLLHFTVKAIPILSHTLLAPLIAPTEKKHQHNRPKALVNMQFVLLWPDYSAHMCVLVCLTLPDGVKCLTGFAQ